MDGDGRASVDSSPVGSGGYDGNRSSTRSTRRGLQAATREGAVGRRDEQAYAEVVVVHGESRGEVEQRQRVAFRHEREDNDMVAARFRPTIDGHDGQGRASLWEISWCGWTLCRVELFPASMQWTL
jgi:hypothetical protein